MSNTDRDAMLERWANGMEKLEQYYENLYGPPSTPATLPAVTDRNGMMETIADELERAKVSINKRSTTYHDTSTAYIKTVPAYAKEVTIEMIGGHTEINAGALVNAEVSSVISKATDSTVLETYSIPAAIQALHGYGWGAGNVYNYIDFERKVYVQNVERVDLGTLTWTAQSTSYRIWSTGINASVKPAASGTSVANIICDSFEATYNNNIISNHNSGIAVVPSGTLSIGIGSNDATELNNLIASLGGKILHYELATPIETDISAYLTDEVRMKVEAGGTLTFSNNAGISVPSTKTFWVDVS